MSVDPHLVCLEDYPIHTVTGLVKQWLRELPDPLMTFAHYNDFLHAVGEWDVVQQGETFHSSQLFSFFLTLNCFFSGNTTEMKTFTHHSRLLIFRNRCHFKMFSCILLELPETQEQLHAIYKVLEELPSANFSTLERLVFHLVRWGLLKQFLSKSKNITLQSDQLTQPLDC